MFFWKVAILGCNFHINFCPRLCFVQNLEGKVTCMKWKLYYSRVHSQIHLKAQFTNWVSLHFQNVPWKGGFLVLKGQKMRPPPETPKLKVREVSQIGFWNISLHPTSVPSFSQIGWPQLLAPGTLSQTMTLKHKKRCQKVAAKLLFGRGWPAKQPRRHLCRPLWQLGVCAN